MTERISRSNFTEKDLEAWLDENRISEIECLVPDLAGVARGKILPREKFTEDRGMRMPEDVLAMTVNGDKPSDDPGYRAVIAATDHDLVLRPDPTTVRPVPWAADSTAQVIHDCFRGDGQPADFVPRSVLRRVIALFRDRGWRVVVAPELEFYLVAKNADPNMPLTPPVGRSGRAETVRRAYSIDAVNEFDPLFEDIYDYCKAMELDVDTLIHEVGAGQMEINFLHGDPLELADQTFYFKRTLRETALRHQMYATFMAKPMANEPGSAMHIHQSLVEIDSGRNIFSDDGGAATPIFRHYLAGLQKYMPAAMALVAPYVNSYRRIVRYGAAPINIQWGHDNRTVGFRVPGSTPENRRVENRVIGADANPYLAIAATLACGWLGIVEGLEPTPESRGSAYSLDYELPRSLSEALSLLEQCRALHDVLGRSFVDVYFSVKGLEYAEFMKVISPWEREHLLLHV
ncbi:MAG TPA: glutamine synthetase family protein [Burkholderiaceae bacterium]|nr:glutamine synthetase family protein [Burkholderiaceae bacterium]